MDNIDKTPILDRIYEETKRIFYKVVMMGGNEIQIEEDEIELIDAGMASGGFIQLKQGKINPSTISYLAIDTERHKEWREILHKYQLRVHESEKSFDVIMANFPKVPVLKDIFAEQQALPAVTEEQWLKN